jgi:hypothetical protein
LLILVEWSLSGVVGIILISLSVIIAFTVIEAVA